MINQHKNRIEITVKINIEINWLCHVQVIQKYWLTHCILRVRQYMYWLLHKHNRKCIQQYNLKYLKLFKIAINNVRNIVCMSSYILLAIYWDLFIISPFLDKVWCYLRHPECIDSALGDMTSTVTMIQSKHLF